jgi:zinc protease
MVSMWYDVGGKHDPEGRSGFAHLFEHVLSRKTVNMPYNMVNRLAEDVGGTRNASTGYDRTNYFEIVPAPYLETLLWTHAERMARPVVDAEVFETERKVVKEELRENVISPPYGRMRLVLAENGWDRMPHRRPGIGNVEQLDAATLEDARAFHEAYYGPDTAILIVSGNFDEAKLQAWVNKFFDEIPARKNKVPLKITQVDPPRTGPRLVTAVFPNVPLPVVGSSWRTPGFGHKDIAALMVLDRILTGGNNSRLYKSLVYEKRLASRITGELVDAEEGGYYAPYVTLAGNAKLEAAEAAYAAEIERLRALPVSASELLEAKSELLAAALRRRETFSGRASDLGEALVRTGDPKAADNRITRIQNVTIADVQRAARDYLAPQKRVDIRYLNETPQLAANEATWRNPEPMPRFGTVAPATRPPLKLAEEGQRQAPPPPSSAVPVTPAVVTQSKLPTGLTVVSARTSDVPIATLNMAIRGGSSTDPAGKAGLATLASELATKGTPTRTAQQIAAEMESLGATLVTNAGQDGIFMSVSAPTANLEAAGRVLADIVQNASFPEDEFEREQRRSVDLLRITLKNPATLAMVASIPLLYGNAPYGTIPIGTPTSLSSVTRADVIGHFQRWWRPANATLVIAGGVDAATSERLATRLFSEWRGEASDVPPVERAGPAPGPRTVVIDMPAAGQAAVQVGVRAFGRSDPDFYNLLLANAVLGGGQTGRLFEEVRVKRGLSYGASSNMTPRMDDAVLTASAQTKNETAAEVAQLILAEFDRLGKEPLSQEAFEKRKAFVTGGFARQSETAEGFNFLLGNLVMHGLPPEEAVRFPERVERVTSEAAAKVAQRIVSSDAATLVIVGDASKFLDKLKAIRPNVEVISIDKLDLDAAAFRGKQ